MKKHLLIILISITLFSACRVDESGYSLIRKYFVNSLTTQRGAELLTACEKDTNAIDEEGNLIESAYYAVIKGEFLNVEDSIIQYGHCWSITDENPHILARDTKGEFYSKVGDASASDPPVVWEFGTLGIFESRIPELDPETPYWVRSYVITSNNDTAYNKYVYADTTLAPVNEWFKKMNFGAGREGGVSFIMYNKEKGYNCGYYGTGNDGSQSYNDFWMFDPVLEIWESLGTMGSAPGRTEAIGFALTYFDENGVKRYRAYIGTGLTTSGTALQDFYSFDPLYNTWEKMSNYPVACSRAVAFTIKGLGYVGTGKKQIYTTNEFYSYTPLADTIGGFPWKQVKQFGNSNGTSNRMNAIAFSVGDFAYVGMGEKDGTYYNDLWRFIPGDGETNLGTWDPKKSLPANAKSRTEAAAFTILNQGYVGGGFDGTNILKDYWRYDPYNDRWYQCADYKVGPNYLNGIDDPQEIRNANGFGFFDRGFVVGGNAGASSSNTYSSELWVYRPW